MIPAVPMGDVPSRTKRIPIAADTTLVAADFAGYDTIYLDGDTSGGDPLTVTLPALTTLDGPKTVYLLDAGFTSGTDAVGLALTSGGTLVSLGDEAAFPIADMLSDNGASVTFYLPPTGSRVYLVGTNLVV